MYPTRGTHWTFYVTGNHSDSYGCPPPKLLSNFVIKKNSKSIFFSFCYTISDSCCSVYCFIYYKFNEIYKNGFQISCITFFQYQILTKKRNIDNFVRCKNENETEKGKNWFNENRSKTITHEKQKKLEKNIR